MWCENSHNRLQIKQKAKEIKGSNISVLLDLEQKIMNIYWNGRLQTDDIRPAGPSLVGVVGPVKPAFSVFGSSVQLSLQTGMENQTTCTGKRYKMAIVELRSHVLRRRYMLYGKLKNCKRAQFVENLHRCSKIPRVRTLA